MYDLSCSDGLNDFSMSIDSTRYRPFNVHTQVRTTYSHFLNIDAGPQVGHEVTIITTFDIPCNLWPVLASLVLARICFILHWNSIFLIDVWSFLRDTFLLRMIQAQVWIYYPSFLLTVSFSICQGWLNLMRISFFGLCLWIQLTFQLMYLGF